MTAEPESAIRDATPDDLIAIVALLADDPLGATRESIDDMAPYRAAFDRIGADPNQRLIVADLDGTVVGVLQLTFIPGLTYEGATRAQIEGVRVAAAHRSSGIGQRIVEWAIDASRAAGCRLLQLTTDRSRPEALAFYERLGFTPSHHGLKLDLRGDV